MIPRFASLFAGALLAMAGCGGDSPAVTSKLAGVSPPAHHTSAAGSRRLLRIAARERDGDGDNDSLGMGPLDPDNDAVPTFGRTAGAPERQAIVSLFRRFYTAAAAGDGVRACSMIYWLAIETTVEEHSNGKGPPSLRGETCAQIATKLFGQHHRELEADRATLKVTIIQLHGKRGWAVLDFAPARERLGTVQREGSAWKLGSLLKYEAL
jgi:hypothetical protein